MNVSDNAVASINPSKKRANLTEMNVASRARAMELTARRASGALIHCVKLHSSTGVLQMVGGGRERMMSGIAMNKSTTGIEMK
jgi:hypothetical protein